MKNVFKKIIFFLIFLNVFSFKVFAFIKPEPTNSIEIIRPASKEKKDENQINLSDDDKTKSSKEIKTITQNIEVIENNDFGYIPIKHSININNILNNFEWQFDEHESKWRLLIGYTSENILKQYARSGFYRVVSDIYYFNNEGYMLTGFLKDDMNILYYFGNDGRFQGMIQQ